MRGAYVQKQEHAAFRSGWRDCCHTAPVAQLTGLLKSDALRQGAHASDAPALDGSQSRRLWRSPGRAGNTMLPLNSPALVSGAARFRVHRESRREPVLFPHAVKNPDMALNVDALLAEQSPNKRLGKHATKLSLPVHIWYLWRSTGIRSDTSKNWKRATGIISGTSGGVFCIPQVSDLNHSYLSHPLPARSL